MKTTVLTSAAAALLLNISVAAAQTPAEDHAGHHPEAASPPAPNSPMPGKDDMSASMQRMQELMAQIRASKDGAERARLLQQHSKAMQDQMQKMHDMNGASSAMPKGGGMMGMQRRMDMMEMMMGQMMQHQEAQENPKPAK